MSMSYADTFYSYMCDKVFDKQGSSTKSFDALMLEEFHEEVDRLKTENKKLREALEAIMNLPDVDADERLVIAREALTQTTTSSKQ